MKRTLIVGIDHYPDQPLAGWVADAEAMAGLAETQRGRFSQLDRQPDHLS
jgi:hypothetical protein